MEKNGKLEKLGKKKTLSSLFSLSLLTSRAISTLSPVIILTSTPISIASSIVCLVSNLGGSRKVSTPINLQTSFTGSSAAASVRATAMQRMPRRPYSVTWGVERVPRESRVRAREERAGGNKSRREKNSKEKKKLTLASTSPWIASLSTQRSRMMCVAPLVTLNLPSGPSIVASVRLTCGSNGMKSRCL
jgi:hypothetical protein